MAGITGSAMPRYAFDLRSAISTRARSSQHHRQPCNDPPYNTNCPPSFRLKVDRSGPLSQHGRSVDPPRRSPRSGPCSAQYDVLLMVGRGGYGGGGEDAQERRQQGSRVHHLILSSSLRANARFVQPHDFVHGCDDARDTPMTMQTKRHRIQPTTTAILPNSTSRIMFVHRGGLARRDCGSLDCYIFHDDRARGILVWAGGEREPSRGVLRGRSRTNRDRWFGRSWVREAGLKEPIVSLSIFHFHRLRDGDWARTYAAVERVGFVPSSEHGRYP